MTVNQLNQNLIPAMPVSFRQNTSLSPSKILFAFYLHIKNNGDKTEEVKLFEPWDLNYGNNKDVVISGGSTAAYGYTPLCKSIETTPIAISKIRVRKSDHFDIEFKLEAKNQNGGTFTNILPVVGSIKPWDTDLKITDVDCAMKVDSFTRLYFNLPAKQNIHITLYIDSKEAKKFHVIEAKEIEKTIYIEPYSTQDYVDIIVTYLNEEDFDTRYHKYIENESLGSWNRLIITSEYVIDLATKHLVILGGEKVKSIPLLDNQVILIYEAYFPNWYDQMPYYQLLVKRNIVIRNKGNS